jgi:light-harvesting complex I chlorophyll a/b binding protein 5
MMHVEVGLPWRGADKMVCNCVQSGVINQFPFDPAGLNSPSMELKQIKNGRLAMVAFVGFAVQALVTREGPIEGLMAHIANPFGHNIVTNIGNLSQLAAKPYN